MPIRKAIELLIRHIDEENVRLFATSFFLVSLFERPILRKIRTGYHGLITVTVLANFLLEDSEELVLSRAAYNSICCFHYIDDL
jgi:hypothetical protein